MIKKKLIERLLIFFVGVPLIIGSIYFLPHYNFLVYHIEMIVAGIIANFEIYNILSQRLKVCPKRFVSVLGVILIVVSYLSGLNLLPVTYIFTLFGLFLVFIFSSEFIFSFKGDFSKSIERMCTGIFMLIYPWGLMLYLSAVTPFKHANIIIIFFYLLVFSCDSCAWLFGMLFGKNNRGLIKASPKKSLIGFLGGFFGPIVVVFLLVYFFNDKFGAWLFELIIIAVVTAVFAILGDIVESILKRSAGIKDSGSVVMGRGGILDSVDSILIAAPVFYIFYRFLIGGV